MGFRPGEWEHLEPAEVEAVEEAKRWRRSRDIEAAAVAVTWLRGMLDKDVDVERVARSFPGYEEPK